MITIVANFLVAVLDLLKGMVEAVLDSGYVGAIILLVFFFCMLAGPLYYKAVKSGVG